MSRSRSRSNRRSSAALGLALLAGGCATAGWASYFLPLEIDGPGGVVLGLVITGARVEGPVAGDVSGEITNWGDTDCHVAIYAHSAPPSPTAIPVLTLAPAPDGPGELLFETVIPPRGDGDPLSRPIGDGWPPPQFDIVPADGSLRAWFSIATCDAPELRLSLHFTGDYLHPRSRVRETELVVEPIWPE